MLFDAKFPGIHFDARPHMHFLVVLPLQAGLCIVYCFSVVGESHFYLGAVAACMHYMHGLFVHVCQRCFLNHYSVRSVMCINCIQYTTITDQIFDAELMLTGTQCWTHQ